jgi:hypothetical protein
VAKDTPCCSFDNVLAEQVLIDIPSFRFAGTKTKQIKAQSVKRHVLSKLAHSFVQFGDQNHNPVYSIVSSLKGMYISQNFLALFVCAVLFEIRTKLKQSPHWFLLFQHIYMAIVSLCLVCIAFNAA